MLAQGLSPTVVSAQDTYLFSLRIMVNPDIQRRTSTANYIQAKLRASGVDVSIDMVSFNTELERLLYYPDEWDMMILGFSNLNNPRRDFRDFLACTDGYFGAFQGTCNSAYQTDMRTRAKSNMEQVNQSYLDSRYNPENIGYDLFETNRTYREVQRLYMEYQLTDIPLFTTPYIVAVEPEIEDYLTSEDVLAAIYRGAYSSTSNETLSVMRPRGEKSMELIVVGSSAQNFLPSLFIKGSDGLPHPNAAIDFRVNDWINSTTGETVPNGYWALTIRDDIYWVDPYNLSKVAPVTPKDFAYGMEALPLIRGSTPPVVSYNDTTLEVIIRSSEKEDYLGENQIAIPSFFFENLTDSDGNITNFSPLLLGQSEEWRNYLERPLQAGPYIIPHNGITMEIGSTGMNLTRNPYYWYPNEDEKDFDLNTPGRESSDFFSSSLAFDHVNITYAENPLDDFSGYDVVEIQPDSYGELNVLVTSGMTIGLREIPDSTGELLLLNVNNRYLQKYDTRKAITHALDRKELVEVIAGGLATPLFSILNPSNPFYTDNYNIDYSMEAASELFLKVAEEVDGYTPTTEESSSQIITSNVQILDQSTVETTSFAWIGSVLAVVVTTTRCGLKFRKRENLP